MKILFEANSGERVFVMSSLQKEIGTVELHHITTTDQEALKKKIASALDVMMIPPVKRIPNFQIYHRAILPQRKALVLFWKNTITIGIFM